MMSYLIFALTHMRGILLSALFTDEVERLRTVPMTGKSVSGGARSCTLSDSNVWTQDRLGDYSEALHGMYVTGRLEGWSDCPALTPTTAPVPFYYILFV